MNKALQKLRLVATTAYAKILLRSTDTRPSKWEETAFNNDGKRDWNLLTPKFLEQKLLEEVGELVDATLDNAPPGDVLREAGDVAAVAMFIADRHGCFKNGLNARAPIIVT